jgi:hypothetical protein
VDPRTGSSTSGFQEEMGLRGWVRDVIEIEEEKDEERVEEQREGNGEEKRG